ncbi:hypothetical protein Bbelb_169990 [Branchiostoma belcheri]|nr:hypothetical protein Bbelb_169990 [Branchiostoma belcheri]
MSGLEPGTSWFRVEHAAATPQDPTTRQNSDAALTKKPTKNAKTQGSAQAQYVLPTCPPYPRDDSPLYAELFPTAWIATNTCDSVQHQGQGPSVGLKFSTYRSHTSSHTLVNENTAKDDQDKTYMKRTLRTSIRSPRRPDSSDLEKPTEKMSTGSESKGLCANRLKLAPLAPPSPSDSGKNTPPPRKTLANAEFTAIPRLCRLVIPPFHYDGALTALSLRPEIGRSAERAPRDRQGRHAVVSSPGARCALSWRSLCVLTAMSVRFHCALTALIVVSPSSALSHRRRGDGAHCALIALSWRSHRALMALSSRSHGALIALSWRSHRALMALSSRSHGALIALSWRSHRALMALSSRSHGALIALSWRSHGDLSALSPHSDQFQVTERERGDSAVLVEWGPVIVGIHERVMCSLRSPVPRGITGVDVEARKPVRSQFLARPSSTQINAAAKRYRWSPVVLQASHSSIRVRCLNDEVTSKVTDAFLRYPPEFEDVSHAGGTH